MSAPALDAEGLRARSLVLRALRRWFDDHGYLEVPTPVRVPSPALEEHLYALHAQGAALRTSPEFALKRVLAAGLPRIYEIGPCFRGREGGPWHGTEFTMLEWYRAGAELPDLMDDVTSLVAAAAEAVGRPPPAPWRRWSVRDLVLDRTGLDLAHAGVVEIQRAAGAPVDADEPWDDAFFRLWLDAVEPTLEPAVFVEDWPATQAALATVRTDGPWPVACRFEAYLHGVELANAFLELTDPRELARRFAASASTRAEAGEPPHPVDTALLSATGRMPRTSGIALGVDRLVAAVMGWTGIGPGRVAVDVPPA